jgi:8-amino-7-oxononanoate synthase
MFTASLPPGIIASTLQAVQRLQEEPELRSRLTANARRLYDGLNELGFTTGPEANPIVAVAMPDRETAIALWNALLVGGLYLNLALPPATPNNTPLLRSSVSAAHTFEQIDQALDLFEKVGRRFGVLSAPARRASA